MNYINIFGLLLAVFLLMFLAYKDINLYFATMVCALIVIITNNLDVWDALQGGYAVSFSNFVADYLYVFVLGAKNKSII